MPYWKEPPFRNFKPRSIQDLLGHRDMASRWGSNIVPQRYTTMGDVGRALPRPQRPPFQRPGTGFRPMPPPQFSVDRFSQGIPRTANRLMLGGLLGGLTYSPDAGDPREDMMFMRKATDFDRRPTIENARMLFEEERWR